MSPFDPPLPAVREIIARALAEDLTPLGDLSAGLVPPGATARASFVARSAGVLAGTRAATEVFAQLDGDLIVTWAAADGDSFEPDQTLGTIAGPLAPLLTGERSALNLLGHCSGVATATAGFVAAAGGLAVWDTRKTTPGLRALEKAAVRAGGAANHRGNLSDWVMLKDNHRAVLDLADAVATARARYPGRLVQVECDTADDLATALAAGADAVLLDNMGPDGVAVCMERIAGHDKGTGTRPLVEVSGGITPETVGDYTGLGIDLVSASAITSSAPVLDIGLDIDARP